MKTKIDVAATISASEFFTSLPFPKKVVCDSIGRYESMKWRMAARRPSLRLAKIGPNNVLIIAAAEHAGKQPRWTAGSLDGVLSPEGDDACAGEASFRGRGLQLRSGSDLNSALLCRRQEIQDHPIDQSRALQLRCVAAAGNHSELKAREVLDRIVHGI